MLIRTYLAPFSSLRLSCPRADGEKDTGVQSQRPSHPGG